MSKSCPELLREAANLIEQALRQTPSQASPATVLAAPSQTTPSTVSAVPSQTAPVTGSRTPVQAELDRLFAPYASRTRRTTNRRSAMAHSPRRSYTHTFCCLPNVKDDKAPSLWTKAELFASGLGEHKVTFCGNDNDPMVLTNKLFEVFPKLVEGGGFELLKIAGSTRSRILASLPCPNTGYTTAYLKDPSSMIGQATLYIRPLQRDLNLDCENSACAYGPLISCITCQKEFTFSEMKLHRDSCDGTLSQESDKQQEERAEDDTETATVRDSVLLSCETPGTSAQCAAAPGLAEIESTCIETQSDWRLITEPCHAAKVFKGTLLREHESGKPLKMKMDMRDSEEDRERALLAFYKQQQEWACPLHCILEGDTAVGDGVMRYFLTTILAKLQFGFSMDLGGAGKSLLFEGEPDHLVPAASETLVESNLFRVAGRMLAHTFLHDGPPLAGLSPAVVHALFNGDPEMATVTVEDCPDFHIRSIIKMLELEELTQEQQDTVSELSLSWDLPAVTKINKKWLHNKLLVHAVVGRTTRQIKQMRKGLKDAMVWPLLKSRPDVVPLLFPRMKGILFTPQLLLDKITWPVMDSDDDDEEWDVDSICRITGYLRTFIETASSDTLAQLLRFWVGWEVLPSELKVEISGGTLPTSSTCFETLKLPAHIKNYKDFEEALTSAINSAHFGFGLV